MSFTTEKEWDEYFYGQALEQLTDCFTTVSAIHEISEEERTKINNLFEELSSCISHAAKNNQCTKFLG